MKYTKAEHILNNWSGNQLWASNLTDKQFSVLLERILKHIKENDLSEDQRQNLIQFLMTRTREENLLFFTCCPVRAYEDYIRFYQFIATTSTAFSKSDIEILNSKAFVRKQKSLSKKLLKHSVR